jgi:hypothetical protein
MVIALIDHGDANGRARQTVRHGEPAEAGADNEHMVPAALAQGSVSSGPPWSRAASAPAVATCAASVSTA